MSTDIENGNKFVIINLKITKKGNAMFKKVLSTGIFGIDPYMVEVEANVLKGFAAFDIVGLPDLAVKESRERIRAAIVNSGFVFPELRLTVNLAPADVKKVGSMYDLPSLIAILMASEQLEPVVDITQVAFIGEVSLGGEVRAVNGVLPMTIEARQRGVKEIFVPFDNSFEAAAVSGIVIRAVKNVRQLHDHLVGSCVIEPTKPIDFESARNGSRYDFSEVKGQYAAKKALEIAAAGGHNVLMIGPPGSGKSMLAKRLSSILPEMTFDESIETTKIHSVAGEIDRDSPLVTERPFRSPHHTVSVAGLTGGGAVPRPGEISMAHNGVLFLDELPEFSRQTLETLRAPLEDGIVTISRAAGRVTYPSTFSLVAAMNPCPCGYFGHKGRKCICSQVAVKNYLSRISGPMLDRLDIHVEVPAVEYGELTSTVSEESSESIRQRVDKARKIQQERYAGTKISCNARLTPQMVQKYCKLTPKAEETVKNAFERFSMSARSYDRLLKICRTVADLDGSELIQKSHVAAAISFRSVDKKYWND